MCKTKKRIKIHKDQKSGVNELCRCYGVIQKPTGKYGNLQIIPREHLGHRLDLDPYPEGA